MIRTTAVAVATAAGVVLSLVAAPGPATAGTASSHPLRPRQVALRTGSQGRPQRIGSLIVRTRDGRPASSSLRAAVAAAAGGGTSRLVRRLATGDSLVSLPRVMTLAEAESAAAALRARPDVVSAEPDIRLFPTSSPPVTPNDPGFPQQWDMYDSADTGGVTGGYSVDAPAAWARTTGSPSVVVAVLDTGITDHPDLPTSAQMAPGYDFVSENLWQGATEPYVANDGDGRDPDPHDPGDWVTAAENAGTDATGGFFRGCVDPNDPTAYSDSNWHGTHVTGTIAALQDNGLGVTGVAPGVTIEPVRVLGKCGGSLSDIADAIEWASGGTVAGVPANLHPAQVINMSLGAARPCDATMQTAIDDARSRGTTVVVAAGNDGVAISPTTMTPAGCSGVIDVEATTPDGTLASYSNYGTVPGSLTVAAPGGDGLSTATDILSTFNEGTTTPITTSDPSYQPGYDYAYDAGTSMATPHVAATVALMQSLVPAGLTPDQVAARLAATATPFPAAAACTPTDCGAGIVDASHALPTAPSLPPAATDAAGNGYLDLSWTAPADNGAPITGYHVVANVAGGGSHDVGTVGPATTSLHITSFADGSPVVNETVYSLTIAAVNAIGEGPARVTSNVIPSAYVVSGATVTGGVETLHVTWTRPTPTDVTGYNLAYHQVGSVVWLEATAPATATSADLTTWPDPMPPGSYEVLITALGGPHGGGPQVPVGTGTVAALSQTVSFSTTTIYPFHDGYLDGTTITVGSNVPAHGVARVVNGAGKVVWSYPLATGTLWTPRWNAVDSSGARVPYTSGPYHVQVLLSGRASPLSLLSDRIVRVLPSKVTKPHISLSVPAVFPVVDHYRDTVTITTSATVPATWSWRILQGKKVVWTRAFRRRLTATAAWNGRDMHGHALPAGTYTFVALAQGGEGIALGAVRLIGLSTKHVKAVPFSVNVKMAAVLRAVRGGVTVDTSGGAAELDFSGAGSTALLTWGLPASVMPVTQLAAAMCTIPQGSWSVPVAGWYAGDPASPVLGPAIPPYLSCNLRITSPPASATTGGVLRIYLSTRSTSTAVPTYVALGLTITGVRFVLVA